MGQPAADGPLHKPTKTSTSPTSTFGNTQGLATLIVMIAVLFIIMMFCCCSAPGIRDLCKRYIFRSCVIDDPDQDNIYTRRRALQMKDEIYSISETADKKRRLSRKGSRPRQQ